MIVGIPIHDHVTVEMVIENLHHNAINAQKVIQETVRRLAANPPVSAAHSALKYAILTRLDSVPVATKEKLALFLKKYREAMRNSAEKSPINSGMWSFFSLLSRQSNLTQILDYLWLN
jgi:hypothetical protein